MKRNLKKKKTSRQGRRTRGRPTIDSQVSIQRTDRSSFRGTISVGLLSSCSSFSFFSHHHSHIIIHPHFLFQCISFSLFLSMNSRVIAEGVVAILVLIKIGEVMSFDQLRQASIFKNAPQHGKPHLFLLSFSIYRSLI